MLTNGTQPRVYPKAGKVYRKAEKAQKAKPAPEQRSIKDVLLDTLGATHQTVDLGTLTKAAYGKDNSILRTRVSAMLSPLVKDPASPVRRVSPGVYAWKGGKKK